MQTCLKYLKLITKQKYSYETISLLDTNPTIGTKRLQS